MIPSFHDAAIKPEKLTDHTFTIDQLLNPLASFETYYGTDDESTTTDLSSTICATCEDCRVELSRLVSDYEQDEEGIIRCQECAHMHRQRKVKFAQEDSITLIPSHRDYTDEEYYGMWTHPEELADNMRRNRMEYQYEGHWKLVLEEDRFIMCSDGQLYHPVTVRLYLRHLKQEERVAKKQEEEASRLANQQVNVDYNDNSNPNDDYNSNGDDNSYDNGNSNDNLDNDSEFDSDNDNDNDDMYNPTKESNNQQLPPRRNIIVPNLAETTVPRLSACVA